MNRQVELVSVSAQGALGDYASGYNSISINRDGSLVSFFTHANNLFSPNPLSGDYALKNLNSGAISALTLPVNSKGSGGGAVAGYETLTLTPNSQFAVFASSSDLLGVSDPTDEDIFRLTINSNEFLVASDPQGGSGAAHAVSPDISDNGRYIVFHSSDNLLSKTDLNGQSDSDVYWYDTVTGQLRMVSGAFDGSIQGGGNGQEGDSWDAHVTNDGRFVVFQSIALNLRPESTGGGSKQLFLRDMVDDQLYLITTDPIGKPSDTGAETAEITPDGRYVVFGSASTNLIDGSEDQGWNIFRMDLYREKIEIVNRSSNSSVVSGTSNPEITPDGRYVVFESSSKSLVPGSSGSGVQVFVKDMVTGAIAMVSTDAAGNGGSYGAYAPQISDDGQYIVFNTVSALVSTDTNGYEDVYRVKNPVYAWGNDLSNDTFAMSPEAEAINGDAGLDLAVFSGEKTHYSISKTASGYDIASQGVTDSLTSIERIQFWDRNIAFDLASSGNAAQAMEFIGVIAPVHLNTLPVRGAIISLFDQGQTMEGLCQLALELNLIPRATNAQLANAVFSNVTGGGTASQEMTNTLVSYIESHSQANFLAAVASLHINVDLVGLQQTGVEYTI